MKKTFAVVMSVFLCFALISCAGKTDTVEITLNDSSIHSKEDLQAAVNVVLNEFRMYYKDCTLTKLLYEGDIGLSEDSDVIELLSEFKTGPNPNEPMNPNNEYTSYRWILQKKSNGDWGLTNRGLG